MVNIMNDSMRLINDICLYGTSPRPQMWGHVMDGRPASDRSSTFSVYHSELPLKVTSAGDLSENSIFLHDSVISWPLYLHGYLDSHTFQPVVEVKVRFIERHTY